MNAARRPGTREVPPAAALDVARGRRRGVVHPDRARPVSQDSPSQPQSPPARVDSFDPMALLHLLRKHWVIALAHRCGHRRRRLLHARPDARSTSPPPPSSSTRTRRGPSAARSRRSSRWAAARCGTRASTTRRSTRSSSSMRVALDVVERARAQPRRRVPAEPAPRAAPRGGPDAQNVERGDAAEVLRGRAQASSR